MGEKSKLYQLERHLRLSQGPDGAINPERTHRLTHSTATDTGMLVKAEDNTWNVLSGNTRHL